jgi:Phycobilisome protein
MLTDRIKELIARARIVSFASWADHPAESIAIFQAAEDARVYLTDADYAKILALSPQTSTLIPIAQLLRDRVVEIVDEARVEVFAQFPQIAEPGGGLYPPERAEACWRDFWHYLRPITYGISGGYAEYTSAAGLENMRILYQELQVPLDAMTVGLEGMKTASLKRIDVSQHSIVSPYFDHLINQLRSFTTQSDRI